MSQAILKLESLTKTYIIGKNKPAKKAMRAIHKLHKQCEILEEKGEDLKKIEEKLEKAQKLFVQEKYLESFKVAADKELKIRKKQKGIVVHALNDVDLEIKEGDLVAIVGPSGSGKSTLLNMLGLLDEPTAGYVYLRGKNITNIRAGKLPEVRSKELGFVFQAFNLIPTLSALENVMLPLKYAGVVRSERKKMAQEVLEKVGLSDRLHNTPNELSGGQKQRVAVARSLVNNPAIIFGDELTGELDSKTTKEVMDLIIELNNKGQTFIIVTHNPEVAKMCKKTITMRDGEIVGQETSS